MSSSDPSDPRLLLPEWLRDGEVPTAAKVESKSARAVAVEEVAEVEVLEAPRPAFAPTTPFSDRLSQDTRLDPGQLVSASDLPAWLGGLEPAAPSVKIQQQQAPARSATTVIEDPEPYEGVDAPENGVIDVEINGWVMLAAALGLLILLGAALRLYLS